MNRKPVLNQATHSQNKETLQPSVLRTNRCHPIERSNTRSKNNTTWAKKIEGLVGNDTGKKNASRNENEKLNHWHGFLIRNGRALAFSIFCLFLFLRLLGSLTVWCYMLCSKLACQYPLSNSARHKNQGTGGYNVYATTGLCQKWWNLFVTQILPSVCQSHSGRWDHHDLRATQACYPQLHGPMFFHWAILLIGDFRKSAGIIGMMHFHENVLHKMNLTAIVCKWWTQSKLLLKYHQLKYAVTEGYQRALSLQNLHPTITIVYITLQG